MAAPTPESQPQGVATIAGNAVGDHPTQEDSLGFTPYVEAITAFLTSSLTQPPLNMSIEGEWGSGKSSFMLQLEKAIRGPSKREVFVQHLPESLGGLTSKGSVWRAALLAWRQRPQITIQFNPWRYDKEDAVWAAFALKFAKNLRQQVGVFRGWKGDISLFARRLKGLRGWMEVILLFTSLLLLFGGAVGLYRFVKTHKLSEVKTAVSILLATDQKKTSETDPAQKQENQHPKSSETNESTPLSQPYEFLLSHGTWGALLALALGGFARFHKQVKLPLSINLEKYLTKPDYQGRVAFIETFHEDFARLVSAYARNRRIFIFIDDLDRCDVPRAAELMQAINLMIADAGKLVFILGMDREKVAAGIVQKFKDLLPFIPEYAISNSDQKNQSEALYFGYSYLEKFIQLSFSLPVISDEASLGHFLSSIGKQRATSGWRKRLAGYWLVKFKGLAGRLRTGGQRARLAALNALTADAPSFSANAVAQEKRVKYLRVKVEKDSDRILKIISMIGPIFENNPRKLKQFINTFRLALYLGSDQGLLDEEEGFSPVTPEQLGKFVAVTLRFPDLRSRLAENPSLLIALEAAAQESAMASEVNTTQDAARSADDRFVRWLGYRGVRDVLGYGVELGVQPFDPGIYSLKAFPVKKLLSILPKVPEQLAANLDKSDAPVKPTEPSDATAKIGALNALFMTMAKLYETIRATQRFGSSRTRGMISVLQQARSEAASLDSISSHGVFSQLAANDTEGARIMALAIAGTHPDRANIGWLLRILNDYPSWFEHHLCIGTLINYSDLLSVEDRQSIIASLDKHWEDITADRDRLSLAEQLRSIAQTENSTVVRSVADTMSFSDTARASVGSQNSPSQRGSGDDKRMVNKEADAAGRPAQNLDNPENMSSRAIALKVSFTLNTPDGKRQISFGLEKRTDGVKVDWTIAFVLFERADPTERFSDPIVSLNVFVASALHANAEAAAKNGLTPAQTAHATGPAADAAKAVMSGTMPAPVGNNIIQNSLK